MKQAKIVLQIIVILLMQHYRIIQKNWNQFSYNVIFCYIKKSWNVMLVYFEG